jgi:hypothetical protein
MKTTGKHVKHIVNKTYIRKEQQKKLGEKSLSLCAIEHNYKNIARAFQLPLVGWAVGKYHI